MSAYVVCWPVLDVKGRAIPSTSDSIIMAKHRREMYITSSSPVSHADRSTRPLARRNASTGRTHLFGGAKNLDHILSADGRALSPEDSRDLLDNLLRSALKPVTDARVDEDLRTVSRCTFDPSVVRTHRWRAGDMVLWHNGRMVHSTSPLRLYGSGQREMWQIIFRDDSGHNSGDGRSEDPGTKTWSKL